MSKPEKVKEKASRANPILAISFILFGGYLLVGSYVSFITGKWPVFMPAQFDLITLFFKPISESAAAYIGGLLLLSIGLPCCWFGVVALFRKRYA
ncbi:MAG: hypothetical protein EOO07_15560 [Chitinophagaceae bacterium]|nr:MAG: hypothetical protein EOO07_15560 [Chitinophagaceae bacterium]